jgi:putative FmdB family regulatory protein
MPTYEYKCSECEELFEVFQKITDDPLKTCQVCGGELKRLISGGMGVIFKGSGFYTTDYKNNTHKSYDPSSKKSDEGEKKEKDTSSTKDVSASADKKVEPAKK